MVWDTTQSTLYTLSGAVERHNADFEGDSSAGNAGGTSGNAFREPPDKAQETASSAERDKAELISELYEQLQTERPSPHEPPHSEPIRARPERIAPCEKCAEVPRETERPPICEDCPRRCPKCGKPLPAHKPSTLEALLTDKDTLLLAALILLLWHEKADVKLIGALAFILFSN